MSYLDFPRIHFTGRFQAAVSTVNNAPLNYKKAIKPGFQPWDVDTWWSAYGNGVFDLNGCTVSAVQRAGSLQPVQDDICNQQVFAGNPSGRPKLVDLDPMQQNVSEIWALTVQIGLGGTNGKLTGNFEHIAFNNIWFAADPNTFGSRSGAGVYQSTLTGVKIDPGNSKVLQDLSVYDRLSIRLQLTDTHNGNYSYDLTPENLETLGNTTLQDLKDGDPTAWANLQNISNYIQGPPQKTAAGIIITTGFIDHLLQRWLGESAANQWRDQILDATRQPVAPGSDPLDFSYGRLMGTVGPPSDPNYITAKRMFTPRVSTNPPNVNFAPFQLEGNVLSVDLSNALQAANPTKGPYIDYQSLEVGTYDGDTFTALKDSQGGNVTVPYQDFDSFVQQGSIFDVELDADSASTAAGTELALASVQQSAVTQTSSAPTKLLAENPGGLWMRADQFVFRMNPTSSAVQADVNVYVTRFGVAPDNSEGLQVTLSLLSEQDSYTYTNSTVGTGGTPGLTDFPLASPASALTGWDTPATVVDGVATFSLSATDPGNPRKEIDGQVYFLRYSSPDAESGYEQGADDLVSVLVFDYVTQDNPTWDNSVGDILSQYGRLYPIMWRFGLDDYESVKVNSAQIRRVLERDMNDPLHMPVTRDLSDSRRAVILQWMDNGMPKSDADS